MDKRTSGIQSPDHAPHLLRSPAEADRTVRPAGRGRSLTDNGRARQESSRRRAPGSRPVRLPTRAGCSLRLPARLRHHLEPAAGIGDTARTAVLEGDAVVHTAPPPSARSMRRFAEVGGRRQSRRTGVGRALLAQPSDGRALTLPERTDVAAGAPRARTHPASPPSGPARTGGQGQAAADAQLELSFRDIATLQPAATTPAALPVRRPFGPSAVERFREIAPKPRSATGRPGAELSNSAG